MSGNNGKRLVFMLVVLVMLFTALPVGALAEQTGEEQVAVVPEVLTEAATEAQVEAPTETEAEVQVAAPTEAVTEVQVEAPTESPTEAQAEVTTEVPTEEPTEPPTEEQTEANSESSTEATTEVVTEEQTEISTDMTTETSTEEATEPTTEETTEETTEAAELTVKLTVDRAYAMAGKDMVNLTAVVTGGIAPYTVELRINDSVEQSIGIEAEGSVMLTYVPTAWGEYKLGTTVTDAAGETSAASVRIIVAEKDQEIEEEWKADFRDLELTGDWHEDIVAIARTQIGYTASRKDFIFAKDHEKQGWTRYGAWYGSSYAEWCGMFVSFCLHYAGITEYEFPYEANAEFWRQKLQDMGVYEDADYIPKAGDLIFLNFANTPNTILEEVPQHVGIVEFVTEYGVYTIEGNINESVLQAEYKLTDPRIVGYANTTKLMDLAGKLEPSELDITLEGTKVTTIGSNVNLRAEATIHSNVVAKIEEVNTELAVLGTKTTGDMVWYQVQYGEAVGYIRSDLVERLEMNIAIVESVCAGIAACFEKLGIAPDILDQMMSHAYGNDEENEEAQALMIKQGEGLGKDNLLTEVEQQMLGGKTDTCLYICLSWGV